MRQLIKKILGSDISAMHFAYKSNVKRKQEEIFFKTDLQAFKKNSVLTQERFDDDYVLLPHMSDKTDQTPIEPHYTYHPAWAARVLAQTKPEKHIDISSTLNFCTIVSAFLPVEFYDYRPANLHLNNLSSAHADLMKLPFANNSVNSLSCMHTIEHIGLGRYGDVIDYDGDLKAIEELKRVVAPGGNLLIVTPVGKPKIEYNAHRIYSYAQIISYFSNLELIEFSLVADEFEETGIIRNATKEMSDAQNWGCGCFWFRK